jgi:hypothetical protein
MADHFLCVHAHFYQPPRGNPFDGDLIPPEAGAEPFSNYNERVTAECYRPNAELGNFGGLSFNLGSTLARWLERHAPETYQAIVSADQDHFARWGVGNALAQPAHHAILPLSTARDRDLQVRWGLTSFEHRYGHPAEGMWLPEMAVNSDTLQTLHDHGLKFTLLSQGQVRGVPPGGGAGPYWVRLPSGSRLAVYVRDDRESNQIAFNIRTLGGAGNWARQVLAPLRKGGPRLLLVAVDGETFGHHHPGEEQFLHWLLKYEAGAVGFEVTSLGRDLREHPPTDEVEIVENSAWSCWHGLDRWCAGCGCTEGSQAWKPALRAALDRLAEALDATYADAVSGTGADPWHLRGEYLRVRLGQISEADFLAQHGLGALSPARAGVALKLLLAQFHRQRMYTSCTFFFEDLDRPEPRYGLANALRAIVLTRQATGRDMAPAFRQSLAEARSTKSGKSGAEIFDEVAAWVGAGGAP